MKAIGAASPIDGALTMLAFGMGTSVALVVVGLGSSAITRKLARWGTAISAITVMVMGALLIARGAMAGPVNHSHMHHMRYNVRESENHGKHGNSPATPPRPAHVILPGTKYHRVRKTVQSICVVIFILLPLFDIMRFDLVAPALLFFRRGALDQ